MKKSANTPMSDADTARLVALIQGGHPDGMQALLVALEADLSSYARALAGRDEARFAMLMEDIFVEIIRTIAQAAKSPSLRFFAIKTAASVVRRHHDWVFRESPNRRSKENDVGKIETNLRPSHDEIHAAMERLAPEERELMVLRNHLGLSIDEISDVTMRGAARIEEDLFDARQRFRFALLAQAEGHGQPLQRLLKETT